MSSLLIQSSGDPAFDRRLEWARSYLVAGDAEAAAGMLADLAAEAAHFTPAWFLLAEARETMGDAAGAAEAYGVVLARDPDDRMGAGVRLARLGARRAEGAMSPAFVRTLFDQYAPRFDTALRDGLSYRGPEVLRAAVGTPERVSRLIDLGCGTGLAAPLFSDLTDEMVGVDLSPAMVRAAQGLGLYTALHVAEMGAFLAGETDGSAGLILAADALCYVDDLSGIFTSARRVLAPGGILAFTVETHDGPGLILRDTLRYAHGAPLVRAALEAAGFRVRHLEAASTRTEKGAPVPGLVCVAVRD